jgi:hypothetical protein
MADGSNPRAVIGGNDPPAEIDPFDAIKVSIDDHLTEARAWADGTEITSQEQADEVSRLIEYLRLDGDAADMLRVELKKPHDDAITEIQAKFNPLIADLKNKTPGKVPLAIKALKATLGAYLQKLEDEKLARAKLAREEAEATAAAAAQAARAAAPNDLEAQEAAEELIAEAKDAATFANYAEKDRAQAKGGSRAMGLRSYWVPTLVEPRKAIEHYIATETQLVKDFLLQQAAVDIRNGKRSLPGFTVTEERRV